MLDQPGPIIDTREQGERTLDYIIRIQTRTQLRGEGDWTLVSRGRPLREDAHPWPCSVHVDHPAGGAGPVPAARDRGQSPDAAVHCAPGPSLGVRAGGVGHLGEREVSILGLELDVHLPPLRVLLAGAVPSLLSNGHDWLVCARAIDVAALNLTNRNTRRPSSTTVRDRSVGRPLRRRRRQRRRQANRRRRDACDRIRHALAHARDNGVIGVARTRGGDGSFWGFENFPLGKCFRRGLDPVPLRQRKDLSLAR